jgi:hypothetical protein
MMSQETSERKTITDSSKEVFKSIWGFLKSVAQGLLGIGRKKSD